MQNEEQARRNAAPGTEVDLVPQPDDSAFRLSPKLEEWIAVIALGLLVAITFANVLVRYLTDESFAWTEEFSVFLMLLLALTAGSAAFARDRHIRIEFFFERGSAARQRRFAIVSALAVAVMFLAIAVLGARLTWDEYRYGETSPGIGVPAWWYSVWLPMISLLIVVRALGIVVRKWREGKSA
jgi:TRAP-type C4-dicarboxylate transport system permease small subunit